MTAQDWVIIIGALGAFFTSIIAAIRSGAAQKTTTEVFEKQNGMAAATSAIEAEVSTGPGDTLSQKIDEIASDVTAIREHSTETAAVFTQHLIEHNNKDRRG